MSWIDQQTPLKALSAPFNYFASHLGAFNTTVPARCFPCRRLPGRGAADLKVGGEFKKKKQQRSIMVSKESKMKRNEN